MEGAECHLEMGWSMLWLPFLLGGDMALPALVMAREDRDRTGGVPREKGT